MESKKEKNHGKQNHQKMKPYIIMQYLLKNTDENNPITAQDLADILKSDYGINAERRSIYRDIEEINKATIMLEYECDIEEAENILSEDEDNLDKLILKNKYGFYARPRNYTETDIRLLAECVYSAKFLDEKQSEKLADIVCDLVNNMQAHKIKHDVHLTDRVKTNNLEVLDNITEINNAMSKELNGKRHTPEKISFKYLKHTINDIKNQVERRQGETYITNPYALLINDGNYYLLAFDDKKERFIRYRVDRMKEVKCIGEARTGAKEFSDINLKNYTQRVFSMYGGEEKRVELEFTNHLLDSAIDRFGKKDVFYSKSDDKHFTVITKVEVSQHFFGWLLGFGKEVKIVSPSDVREQFTNYLKDVIEMY